MTNHKYDLQLGKILFRLWLHFTFYDFYLTNLLDGFTNFFPNFVHESFSVWGVEKWNKNLMVQNIIFFLSLPIEKEIITNIRRFWIRNWWNYRMNPSIFFLHRTLFVSAKVLKLSYKVTPLKMLCHLYFPYSSDQCARKILQRQFEPFFDRLDTRYISYINITTNVCVQYVSSIVEFWRWWVLKCKIFAQESTCSKEISTMNYGSSKSAKIVLSKSIFYVKNLQIFFKV